MKIKFLGTSAGWPLPRLGCKCKICTSHDPKDTRARTQVLVNDSILLDAGPDTYRHLIDNHPENLKAILISHEHPDHVMGLHDISHTYNLKNPIDIIITQPVLNGIKKYLGPDRRKIKIKVVYANQPFLIDHVRSEYIPVVHGNIPAFAIKLKDAKIFTYIPDFNRILPSNQKSVRHSQILAIDGSSFDKIGKTSGHISIKDGIQIAKNLKVQKTYFIHIGHKTGTHQSLQEYLRENAGRNFIIAYDGLEINV